MAATREEVVQLLITAYRMELETVMNYVANGINLDGVRAEEIKKSLIVDVPEELAHAQQLAARIKQLSGRVPGSLTLKTLLDQQSLQPSSDSTDVIYVIRGVIAAEESAIAQYRKIIRACEGEDYVTQDLCIRIMAAEEEHLVMFRGFLKEYTQGA
jgi:bacterioferritin